MPLGEEVSKASIAKILDISRCALHFIETRKIVPERTRHPYPNLSFCVNPVHSSQSSEEALCVVRRLGSHVAGKNPKREGN